MSIGRSPITTHILDVQKGRPASGVHVSLYAHKDGEAKHLADGVTNTDGRVEGLLPTGELEKGLYELRFATGDYFTTHNVNSFYPEVRITFAVSATDEHYHVPLLLSAFGYSTYRGS